MGLIKAAVVLIIAVGIADFIKRKQDNYKDHPYYGYISPYIANRCNIIPACCFDTNIVIINSIYYNNLNYYCLF